MPDKTLTYSAFAALLFCGLAIIFAGFGGLVESERGRMTLAAVSAFWLLMLLVPGIFLSQREVPLPINMGLAMAAGAVVGLCYGLCFDPGRGLMALIEAMASGAALGFVSFWAGWFRYAWRR